MMVWIEIHLDHNDQLHVTPSRSMAARDVLSLKADTYSQTGKRLRIPGKACCCKKCFKMVHKDLADILGALHVHSDHVHDCAISDFFGLG